MSNKTPFIVGDGLKGRREKEIRLQQAADNRLAAQRDPQILRAIGYIGTFEGIALDVTAMAVDDPMRIIFLDTLEAFRTARAVKRDNVPVKGKGAVWVAAEAAKAKNKAYFDNADRAASARAALKWAEAALKFAGDQLYKEKIKAEAAAQFVVPAPSTDIKSPTPAHLFGRKVQATA